MKPFQEKKENEDMGEKSEETENLTIRKLTERECLRLMAYTDEEIDRLANAVDGKGKRRFCKTAMYRFAGNSVVVDVYAEIFEAILDDRPRGLEAWM